MGAEDGQRVHVLLRVVQLVEAPEHPHPVVGQVDEPVAAVHRDEDHGHGDPAGHQPIRGSTSHGKARVISSAKERVSAVTSGTTRVTLSSV